MATKKITEAIQTEQTKTEAVKSKQVDPAKQLKAKKAAETKKKAQEIVESGILNPEIVDKYNALLTTMKETEERIKVLFEIEATGLEFADVINAKTAYAETVDAELKFNQEMAETKLKDTEAMIAALNAQYEADLAARKAEDEKLRIREEEDYKYNRDRERKLENDLWEDEKAGRIKVVEDREKAATQREEALLQKETHIKELEEKVAEIPAILSKTREEAEEAGNKKAKAAFTIETNYLKKDFENQIALKDNKIEILTAQLADAGNTIKSLQEKLDAAYNKIQEVSLKTVEGVKANEVMDAVKRISNNSSSSK